MEKEKLLDIKDLSVTYKTEDGIVYAVNNLNLTLEPKETLGFVGETGAGNHGHDHHGTSPHTAGKGDFRRNHV